MLWLRLVLGVLPLCLTSMIHASPAHVSTPCCLHVVPHALVLQAGLNPMYTFRETVDLGPTNKSMQEIRSIIQQLKQEWPGAGGAAAAPLCVPANLRGGRTMFLFAREQCAGYRLAAQRRLGGAIRALKQGVCGCAGASRPIKHWCCVAAAAGSSYDLLYRNCCHFCVDLAARLEVGPVPGGCGGCVGGLEDTGQQTQGGTGSAYRWLHACALSAAPSSSGAYITALVPLRNCIASHPTAALFWAPLKAAQLQLDRVAACAAARVCGCAVQAGSTALLQALQPP